MKYVILKSSKNNNKRLINKCMKMLLANFKSKKINKRLINKCTKILQILTSVGLYASFSIKKINCLHALF